MARKSVHRKSMIVRLTHEERRFLEERSARFFNTPNKEAARIIAEQMQREKAEAKVSRTRTAARA